MLNRIGASCSTKWSRGRNIVNFLFHTRVYADCKDSSKPSSALDLVSKYDKQTTEQILRVLNETNVEELIRYDVTKSRTQKMVSYRKANGPFETIEQVLEVDDFGAKVLEKLVVSIAKNSRKEPVIPEYKPPSKLLNYIATPTLDNNKRRKTDTVTSICIGLKHISWARIESSGRVLSWNIYGEFEWPKKDNPMLLHDLALKVRQKLPVSDIYVTERAPSHFNSSITQPNTIFSSLQRQQLTMMLVTILATNFDHSNEADETRWTAINNCFFLRREVTAQLFHLIIGNETVSAHTVINQIMDDTISKSMKHIPRIAIDFLEIGLYNRSDLLKKDAMSQALLMSIAFMELVVKHNPLSLKELQSSNWRN